MKNIFLILIAFFAIAVFVYAEPLSIIYTSSIEDFETKNQEYIDSFFSTPYGSTAIIDSSGKINGDNSVHVNNRVTKNIVYKSSIWEVKIKPNKIERLDIVLHDEDYPNGNSFFIIFGTGNPRITNFPEQDIMAYNGQKITLWNNYQIDTVYHIICDFNYLVNTVDISISDGIDTRTKTVDVGSFDFISSFSIGENNANFYLDDISMPDDLITEGKAHIMDNVVIPAEIKIDTDGNIAKNSRAMFSYNTDNYGTEDVLFGRIININDDSVLKNTCWEDNIADRFIHEFSCSYFNYYPFTDFRIEVGHIDSNGAKIIDETYAFNVSYTIVEEVIDPAQGSVNNITKNTNGFEMLTFLGALFLAGYLLSKKKK